MNSIIDNKTENLSTQEKNTKVNTLENNKVVYEKTDEVTNVIRRKNQ